MTVQLYSVLKLTGSSFSGLRLATWMDSEDYLHSNSG